MRSTKLIGSLLIATWCGTAVAGDSSSAPHPSIVASYPGGVVRWDEFERALAALPPPWRRRLLPRGDPQPFVHVVAFRRWLLDQAQTAGYLDLAKLQTRRGQVQERLAIRMLLGGEIAKDARTVSEGVSRAGVTRVGRLRLGLQSLFDTFTIKHKLDVDERVSRSLESIEHRPAAAEKGSGGVPTDGAKGPLTYRMPMGAPLLGPECEVTLDRAQHRILVERCRSSGTEDGLSDLDVLFFELFLSGDDDNVLFRHNLEGVSHAKVVGASPMQSVVQALTDAERPGAEASAAAGQIPTGAYLVRAQAYCSVAPSELSNGTLSFCTSEECAYDDVLKTARLSHVGGAFLLEPIVHGGEPVGTDILDLGPTGIGGAHRFSVALPARMVRFEELASPEEGAEGIWCRLDRSHSSEPAITRWLGRPTGSFER